MLDLILKDQNVSPEYRAMLAALCSRPNVSRCDNCWKPFAEDEPRLNTPTGPKHLACAAEEAADEALANAGGAQ